MVTATYVPERGDLIWLNFTPQSGHEQAGKRPAIVMSPSRYNAKTGLCVVCPITSRVKNYPFEVKISGKEISGVVLSDQVKSLDWKARKAKFAEKALESSTGKVLQNIQLLIG